MSDFHIRRLPHYSALGQPIFLTWRLSGSLPVNRSFSTATTSGEGQANRMLGRTGPFWQDESYDRLVRNLTEFEGIGRYIEMNPVRAGLVGSPEAFRWCSARPIANRPQVTTLPDNVSHNT